MINDSSIKWRPVWKLWIPIILFLVPLILEDQLIGTLFTPYVYGLLVFIIGIIYYFRFRLWQSIVVTAMTTIAISGYFLAARPEQTAETFQLIGLNTGPDFIHWMKTYLTMPVWFGILIINFVIYYTIGPLLSKALDLEKSAIRLFKLAARGISGEENGFTGRPYQAGEHGYQRNQLYGLAAFLEQKKICVAEFTGSGIKYIYSMGISPLNKSRRDELSYVAFQEDGKLNVYISKHDYKQYRKEYTFDQLCELMGNTFLRFAEYHQNNMESRIIVELKSV